MKIPKSIEVKDSDSKSAACLSPRADALKDAYLDVRLNGESTLEFMLPSTSEKLEELTPECEIWVGGRVYILRKDDAVDTVRDSDNKLWSKFMAIERWGELDSSYVEPSISNDPTASPPADLAILIVGNGSNLSGGRYPVGTAGHALYAILQGTGWTLGTVDVIGIRDLEMEKVSRLGVIKAIQNIWGGYLIWDSVNKIVHLRDANKWQNYTGFGVVYRKNLKHITRTESNKLITKLYAFGHDDLDIANINGGKKFITNNSYTPVEYIGIYKNQDIYNQDELKQKATAELKFICRPRYLYRVQMVDLRTLPEYSHEDFELGDMVDIIDPSVAPDSPRPRLIRHRYNIFKPWDCELEIGDPEERLIEKLSAGFKTTTFIENKFNGNGDFSGNSLENDTVTDKKIKNLNAEKITAGFLDADRIKAGSISIGKVDDGFVPGLNLLENPVFSSYASQVNTIDGKVTTQGTLIQQNAQEISLQAISISKVDGKTETNKSAITVNSNQISLQATSITNLGQDIARVDIKANNINLVVGGYDGRGGLVGDVDDLDYDMYNRYGRVSIMQDEIDIRVVEGDVIAAINMSPERISIDADRIDLRGVTSIYSRDARSVAEFGGSRFTAFNLYDNSYNYFGIKYVVPGVAFTHDGEDFMGASNYGIAMYNHVTFMDGFTDRGRRNFTPSMEMQYDPNINALRIKDFGDEVGVVELK